MRSRNSLMLLCLLAGFVHGLQFDPIAFEVSLMTRYGYKEAEAYAFWGDKMDELSCTKEAIKCYDKAIQKSDRQKVPSSYTTLRGILHTNVRQYKSAERDFTASISAHPDNFNLFALRGGVRKQLGYSELAQQDFKRAQDLYLRYYPKCNEYLRTNNPEVRQGKQSPLIKFRAS